MPARRRRRAGMIAVALLAASCGSRDRAPRTDAAATTRHEVTLHGFAFDPPALVVGLGDTVAWRNADIVPHTVTRHDSAWDSDSLPVGATWTAPWSRTVA